MTLIFSDANKLSCVLSHCILIANAWIDGQFTIMVLLKITFFDAMKKKHLDLYYPKGFKNNIYKNLTETLCLFWNMNKACILDPFLYWNLYALYTGQFFSQLNFHKANIYIYYLWHYIFSDRKHKRNVSGFRKSILSITRKMGPSGYLFIVNKG